MSVLKTLSKMVDLVWTRRLHVASDMITLTAAFSLAYAVRFDLGIPAKEWPAFQSQIPVVVLIQALSLICCGAYAFIWRYISLGELKNFVLAAMVSASALLAMGAALPDSLNQLRVPLSVSATDTVLGFGAIVGVRILRRAYYERFERPKKRSKKRAGRPDRVLLIGAGRTGRALVNEVQSCGETALDIRGFVDDDPEKAHRIIHGVTVIGRTQDLPSLVREFEIDYVVVTFTHAPRSQFRRLLDICEAIPVKVRSVPSLWEMVNDHVSVSRIRDFDIADLLGRRPVHLGEERHEQFLQGKVVLVTGAGGSIGSELARQIARQQPAKLLLLERAEPALFSIETELRRAHPDLHMVPLLTDASSYSGMHRLFARYKPHAVVHAAAHKHVPLSEANVADAVQNNVFSTQIIADLAGRFSAEVMVLISTDKAVKPTSILGATKRVAELIIQDANTRYNCRFVAVRFGNVIGSAGSVIPVFREQIRRGGPVTVTHKDMVRYFMTIPEASQLVLEATAMGRGGEIFILDMGEPVSILSLAEDVITLSGLRPYEDVDIVFTGIRPGEKVAEELNLTEEAMSRTRHRKIFIGKIACPRSAHLHHALSELRRLAEVGDDINLRASLARLVPEAQLHGIPAPAHVSAGEGRVMASGD